MQKLLKTQFFILLAGTLFAWTNFGIELNKWLQDRSSTVGCTPGITNPFLTPCFYGAVIFLTAFIVSIFILKKYKQA